MHNCRLDSLRGYSYKLSDTIVNCPYYMNGGIFMPLANSLQFFDGKKSRSIYECKREISAIDIKGHFICIGQRASPGQLISAVLLDIRAIEKPRFFNYQKTQINFITVSPEGQFICSVGSNSSEGTEELCVIQVNNQSQVGTRVYFSKTFKKKDGKVKAVKFSNTDPTFFVVLTASKVILMRIDTDTQSVQEVEVNTSKVRQYNNIIFGPDDNFLYGCSKNGDISEISIEQTMLDIDKQTRIGPRKRVITKGILNLKYLHPGYLVISGKQGLIALIELSTMSMLKQIKLQDQEIITLSQFNSTQCYFSTNKANIYRFNANTFDIELCYSSHTSFINDLVFMKDFQGIFATCSGNDIMVWKTRQLKPIIKIALPKVVCLSLCLPKNGKFIISGWQDDCIRIFSPNNGKLLHKINQVNLDKVTKIITNEQSTKMICGGQNGMIRLWNIQETKMFGLILGSLAFHLKKVHNLKINPYNIDQLVSSGDDGYCAIWSLSKFQLRNSFYVTSFIKEVHFMDEIKLMAVGSGSYIFQCMINNGQIVNKIKVNGTCINAIADTHLQATDERLLLYGGDDPHLNYIQTSYGGNHQNKMQSYGVITRMQVACNKESMIAVTQNGVILKYEIFAIKKMMDQKS